MADTPNPLKQYFRQPSVFVRLPTKGIWYKNGEVTLTGDNEVAIYPMSAIDDIMLNTPDAMLNETIVILEDYISLLPKKRALMAHD